MSFFAVLALLGLLELYLLTSLRVFALALPCFTLCNIRALIEQTPSSSNAILSSISSHGLLPLAQV
jgi:hypothetical protein